MSIKTEESKIVELTKKQREIWRALKEAYPNGTLHDDYKADLATYKASIISKCEKCVPKAIETEVLHQCQCGNPIICRGHNDCRTQTLQAINSLKV